MRALLCAAVFAICITSTNSPALAGGDTADILTGAAWQVIQINGKPTLEDAPASLQFDSDGTLAGQGSCNRYTARYSMIGDGLKIDPRIAATRMMCPPGPMEQEQRFFAVLPTLNEVSILADGGLQLIGSDGSFLLVRR